MHRSSTPEQKADIVLAGLRGTRTVRNVGRGFAETLDDQWRDRRMEVGEAALSTSRDTASSPEAAEANPTDGIRMVTAIVSRGWVNVGVIVDYCTRDVTGWRLVLRTRTQETVGCVEQAVTTGAVPAGVLTLGTDNGSQSTSRGIREHLSARGVTHRGGGYRAHAARDPTVPSL